MADFFEKCPLPKVLTWSTACYQSLVSKVLSIGILTGSVILKLPQILNIVKTQDVKGLAPESFYTEVPLTTITVLYNIRQGYSFSTYGESVMILIQNLILVLLLWQYSKPNPSLTKKVSVLGVFGAIAYICYVVPGQYLRLLPLTTLPLMVYSRAVQIISSFKHKTTGQLSSITVGLTFLGSIARVFTTITDVGVDLSLLLGFGLGTLLSGVQLGQVRSTTTYYLTFHLFSPYFCCRFTIMNIARRETRRIIKARILGKRE